MTRVEKGGIVRYNDTGKFTHKDPVPQTFYLVEENGKRDLMVTVGLNPMVVALHHVNVTVPPELEQAAKEFYGAVVGLQEIPKPKASRQSGAWYQIGANQLHLSVEREDGGPLSSRHVCLTVSDLRAAETRFREAGVEIIPDARPTGPSRFYVRDPAGNMLEIVQAST